MFGSDAQRGQVAYDSPVDVRPADAAADRDVGRPTALSRLQQQNDVGSGERRAGGREGGKEAEGEDE